MITEVQPINAFYTAGEQGKVGSILHEHLQMERVRNQLHERNYVDILKDLGEDEKLAVNSIFKAYKSHQDGERGFYILKAAESVIGMASVDPQPKLRRLKYEIPVFMAIHKLSTEVDTYGPQIKAWINPAVVPNAENRLADAVEQLKDVTGPAKPVYDVYRVAHAKVAEPIQAWMIEPYNTPMWIQRALRQAGMTHSKGDSGHYDDGQSRRHSPPGSKLYIASSPLPKS